VISFKQLMEKIPRSVVRAKGFIGNPPETFLFSWVMGQKSLEPKMLPPDRSELLNRLVFIAPPEVMPQLEALHESFPGFQYQSTYDPMKRQESS
jgi:hypothetical protein